MFVLCFVQRGGSQLTPRVDAEGNALYLPLRCSHSIIEAKLGNMRLAEILMSPDLPPILAGAGAPRDAASRTPSRPPPTPLTKPPKKPTAVPGAGAATKGPMLAAPVPINATKSPKMAAFDMQPPAPVAEPVAAPVFVPAAAKPSVAEPTCLKTVGQSAPAAAGVTPGSCSSQASSALSGLTAAALADAPAAKPFAAAPAAAMTRSGALFPMPSAAPAPAAAPSAAGAPSNLFACMVPAASSQESSALPKDPPGLTSASVPTFTFGGSTMKAATAESAPAKVAGTTSTTAAPAAVAPAATQCSFAAASSAPATSTQPLFAAAPKTGPPAGFGSCNVPATESSASPFTALLQSATMHAAASATTAAAAHLKITIPPSSDKLSSGEQPSAAAAAGPAVPMVASAAPGDGAGWSFSLSAAEYRAASEAATLASPRVAAKLRQQQHQAAAYSHMYLVAQVVELEARRLAEETLTYFTSLVNGRKASHAPWLALLAHQPNGRTSVLYLCMSRWKRMLAAAHERRAAYTAKRAGQRDAVLSSLSIKSAERGLAGLALDGPAHPVAPLAGWREQPPGVSVHQMLQQQRLRGAVHVDAQDENMPPPPSPPPPRPATSTLGLNLHTGSSPPRATAVDIGDVGGAAHYFAHPLVPAAELSGAWSDAALPSWVSRGARTAESNDAARERGTAAAPSDPGAADGSLSDQALQYVLGAAHHGSVESGEPSNLRRLLAELAAAREDQASTERDISHLRLGRAGRAPADGARNDGDVSGGISMLTRELSKAQEDARRVEERLRQLQR